MNHRVALGDALCRNRCVRVGFVQDCLSKYESFWRRAENLGASFREDRLQVDSGVPRNFVQGGSTNSIEDRRQNWDLGPVAP